MAVFLGGIGSVKSSFEIPSKYRNAAKKALEWDAKYDVLNDKRERADGEGDTATL
jgi:hypothetical protein